MPVGGDGVRSWRPVAAVGVGGREPVGRITGPGTGSTRPPRPHRRSN